MVRTMKQKHACMGCQVPHEKQESPVKTRSVRQLRTRTVVSVKKEKSVSNDNIDKDKKLSKKSKVLTAKKQPLPKRNESNVQQTNKTLKSRIPRNVKRKSLINSNESTLRNNEIKRRTTRAVKSVRINEKSVKSRQLSLKESFFNQSRQLRSKRKNKLTVPEVVVVLEKLPIVQSKIPVYKSVKLLDDSAKNETEIYDFKFDANDSKERIKRRKKRINRKAITKTRKKNVNKKGSKLQAAKTVSDVREEAKPEEKEKDLAYVQNAMDVQDNIEVIPDKVPELLEPVKPNEEVAQTPLSEEAPVIKKADVIKKPIIVAVENISDQRITMTSTPPASKRDEFKPFRPTNVFNNNQTVLNNKSAIQYKNILNYSLLNKSMSPITKSLKENFDPGSPWRPPLFTFSQVKDLFQSTPQNNKIDVFYGRLARNFNNDSNYIKATQANIMQKNSGNVLTQKTVNKNGIIKKTTTTSRRFGTEITNINQSTQSNVNNAISEINERTTIDAASTIPNGQPIVLVDTVSSEDQFDNIVEDKENAAPNYQTPKKSPKKKVKHRSPFFSQKLGVKKTSQEQENFEPQPGPSGLQKLKYPDEQTVLRQSNLNNYLNLMEVPQSTRISTIHGIFDDAHSTPISGKPVKKLQSTKEPDIENAFGFCDSESNDLDISPIEPSTSIQVQEQDDEKGTTENSNKGCTAPARLSIGEIKNKLLMKKIKKRNIKGINEATKKSMKNDEVSKQKKNVVDVINFSDTFDVLSETGEVPDNVNPPLFVDLEPTHFTKPPTHSYKRKRKVEFSFSEDESGEDGDVDKCKVKRKKTRTLNKEEKKRLEKWVKSVNDTFHEIDQYDLLVE